MLFSKKKKSYKNYENSIVSSAIKYNIVENSLTRFKEKLLRFIFHIEIFYFCVDKSRCYYNKVEDNGSL